MRKFTTLIPIVHKRSRIPELDFIKGMLVLTMVLYHWLNYFVSPQGHIYNYLRFLTPSFIFISGFLISHIYFSNQNVTDPTISRRLLQRGLKILAIFIFLNALRGFIIPDSRSGFVPEPWSIRNLIAIYATGNVSVGGSKVAIFPILVPIGYLLLLSAGLAIVSRYYKYTFQSACLFFTLSVVILGLMGLEYGNLEHLTIGLIGVTLGYFPAHRLTGFVRHQRVLVTFYVVYIVIVSVWTVAYPIQVVGVFLNIMLIYLFSLRTREQVGSEHVALLGKYSLFGYIAQIAVLQMLYRGLQPLKLENATLVVISFVSAFALTILSVEVLDRVRRRTVLVDRLYRAVFA
jgi:peptidoglycan/LPS O-acetylase OafA/YrhL